MQVDVSDILGQGEGAQAEFAVSEETPQLENIALATPIQGEVRIMATKQGVLAAGRLETDIRLECSRCLKPFNHQLAFPLNAEFEDHPQEDQFPIDKHGRIDLAEPIRQEIEVHLPITALCQDDCPGIELNQTKDT